MKNIVITGSSKGLGFEMAKRFLAAGCNVTLSAHNTAHLEKAAAALSTYTANIYTCPCDVSNEADIINLWNASKAKWGNIDIWINNAGVPQETANLWEIPHSELQTLIHTNLMGAVYGTQIAVKGMLQQGHGQVYNMEGFGSNGMRRASINWYGTTKNAITHFTQAMAEELVHTPIQVGRLSPGMMVTDFITGHGKVSAAAKNIYNILGDKPDAPARFLVDRMLHNTKNNAHLVWLTNSKIMLRFVMSVFSKRDLFK